MLILFKPASQNKSFPISLYQMAQKSKKYLQK
nr:MAG TPA: hypothetical protein [Caudoviricetes sp.]